LLRDSDTLFLLHIVPYPCKNWANYITQIISSHIII